MDIFSPAMVVMALLAANIVTYALYWWDKKQACWNGARVPEAVLLLAGFLGGSPAGFIAQRVLRHKNRKTSFQLKFWVLVAVQLYLWLRYIMPPPPL